MKRRRMPHCPFCRMQDGSKSRMHPQVSADGWISYVCDNPHCQAVSPRERTYNRALERAYGRSEPVLMWFNRDDEPIRDDLYLVEYVFIYPQDPQKVPVSTYYGVYQWKPDIHQFTCEGDLPPFTCRMKVIRWADFKDDPVKTEEAE